MIRIIVRIDDDGMAVNVGGPVQTTYRTFDIDHEEIEQLFANARTNKFCAVTVVGADITMAGRRALEDGK